MRIDEKQPEGSKRPIRYWSRTILKAEKEYETTQLEFIEVVCVLLLFRVYLEDNRFTVRIDYSYLRWILNPADKTGRLERWRL